MFDNINRLIKDGYSLVVESERYGDGLLMGLEYDPIISEIIYCATAPDNFEALKVLEKIEELEKKYPVLLFVRKENFYECLIELDKKAFLWKQCSKEYRAKITQELDHIS